MKKKIFTVLMAVLMCVGFCICFAGCFDFGKSDSDGGIEQVGSFHAYTEKQGSLGYIVYVDGTLKNTSKKTYTLVSISFSVYDEDGNNIGTAMDNMNYLGTGETWQYHAQTFEFYKTEPSSVKLVDITFI